MRITHSTAIITILVVLLIFSGFDPIIAIGHDDVSGNQPVLKGRQRELGGDHPKTLETVNDLGILHRQQKHYEKSEEFLNKALEGRKIKLGDDHPHTLQTVYELAILYKEQGDYDKAESLLVGAFKGRRLKLGDTHPHTLESWRN